MGRIAKDRFSDDHLTDQGRSVRQVTPSDTDELEFVCKALLIETDGDVCMEPADGYFDNNGTKLTGGITRTFTAGQVFDTFRVRQVYQTGTTATVQAID